ncbi:CU044_5270 family protein [Dactylosporangium sp. CA-233914]|uniref:CU044_5270 family protein n=1 Tax=Dactylosporangium sp. CA-233914 TaxID=3239934 RepID=UPI003D9179CF
MFDTSSTKALLGPADPARGLPIPPPHARAVDLIAVAEATVNIDAPSGVRRRRILVPVAAGVAAAGLIATGVVASGLTDGNPSGGTAGQATGPTPTRTAAATPTLGPVIRPVAFEIDKQPPATGDQLRALAAQLAPSRCDTTTGKYTFIHTIGWNAVFDDTPDGKSQRIIPSERWEWRAADGSERIRTTFLPAVYPNEESYQYFQKHPVQPTGTPAADVNDLPPNPNRTIAPLPTDPAEIAKRLAGGDPFLKVRDWFTTRAVPLATRAELLRILANTAGVVWRGETTDRAGRKGLAVSLDDERARHVLIFDPRTGEMLAWDDVERPVDTVAGSKMLLACEHTDKLG